MRITDYITQEEFSDFCAINNFKTIFHIVKEWILIIAAVVLCEQYWSWWGYLFVVWWIAARKHGMLWLAHDGIHSRMFKSSYWNDFVSMAFLMTPNFFSFTMFQEIHISHHRHLGNKKDPENRPIIREKVQGMSAFIKYLMPRVFNNITFGFAIMRFVEIFNALKVRFYLVKIKLFGGQEKDSIEIIKQVKKSRVLIYEWLFYVISAVVITHLEGWKVVAMYWLVPHFTVLSFMILVRCWAEHEGVKNTSPLTQTRTVVGSWFDRLLFTPNSGHFHLEHHLAAGVPHYNLEKIHKCLMKNDEYRDKALISGSYLEFMVSFFNLKKAK